MVFRQVNGIFFHPNGNKEGRGSLVNGKRQGIWTWYHPNGNLFTERIWENGKLINILSCFDEQGNKLDTGTLKNGTGAMKVYNSEGKLLETFSYLNGEYIEN